MRTFCFLFIAAALDAEVHMSNARYLVDSVDPRNNRYAHERSIRWPTTNSMATVSADCSSLLNELWVESYLKNDAALTAMFGKPWPKARDWYREIVRGKFFLRITNVLDIVEGDIIAVYYPRGMVQTGDTNTGHVMLVNAKPKRVLPRAPRMDGEQYSVQVIDSTASPHGKDDTRSKKKGGDNSSGIGIGTIRLYMLSNECIGYAWSMTATNWYASNERPLAVGRYRMDRVTK